MAKNKVTNAVANVVIAFPSKLKARRAKRKADFKVQTLREVRAMKGVPDKGNQSDPLFRKRMVAKNIRFDSELRNGKLRKVK